MNHSGATTMKEPIEPTPDTGPIDIGVTLPGGPQP